MRSPHRLRVALAALLALCTASAALAQGDFYLHNGDRVVFYGDSITDQRLYTTYTEVYVVTRFPKMNVTFVHSGWGGDRVTGGGGGPIDLRLKRDVIAYNPTVMTIMLGMNDAGYRPFDQGLFDTYAKGYQHIVDSVKSALPSIRFTLIQPSPFDDVTRSPSFAGGYNSVLVRYGDYVKELAQKEHLTVADQNTPVVAALEKAKSLDTSTPSGPQNMTLVQRIIPDRVHPGPGGHLLMAEAILKAWNAPSVVSEVEIRGTADHSLREKNTHVSGLQATGTGLSWIQTDSALPLPIDMNDAPLALAVRASDVVDALDQETLKVTYLPAARYALKIDGQDVGTFTKDQLAEGINLATLSTPMLKQAMDVLALTRLHNDIHFMRWRQVQVPHQDDLAPYKKSMDALDAAESAVVREQRAAAQPRTHRYELVAQ